MSERKTATIAAGSKHVETAELYGVPFWSEGYFKVAEDGTLRVSPLKTHPHLEASLKECVEKLRADGHSLPLLLRFPQILEDRVQALNEAFQKAIQKFEYSNHYQGVYPIKVNQQRLVVETLSQSGVQHKMGLEAGSKAELILCLAQELSPDGLLCCNGFKDDDFIRLALWGRRLGKNVVLTLEKFSELERVLRISRELDIEPVLGVRFKLHARGSGRWEDSGGDQAKFGLDATQVVATVRQLRKQGLLHCLQMLHCHVGSQITNIRKIKVAVREIARTYADLVHMGAEVRYLNVGGGLAVDYDGSRTTFYVSANYGLQEYADDVVYTTLEVCDEAEVPHPVLVSESGRALTAHHAVVVVSVIDVISSPRLRIEAIRPGEKAQSLIDELRELLETVNLKNYAEVFNDAVSDKETMHDLFDLGFLSLTERAVIEELYYRILERIAKLIRGLDYVPEEFEVLPRLLAEKYVCNFSLFQSLPDHWAIQGLFPLVPLSSLDQRPSRQASLVDITCDSDGKIAKFIDLRDVKSTLPLHRIQPGEAYYLGIFLAGAYQDGLANNHNLLGRVSQAYIRVVGENRFEIVGLEPGQTAQEVISHMGYQPDQLILTLERQLDRSLATGQITRDQAQALDRAYRSELQGYTYLED